MGLRPPPAYGMTYGTLMPKGGTPSELTIQRVMTRWDEGLDTLQIAREMVRHESDVVRALYIGRERRRMQQVAQALHRKDDQ